MLKKGIHLKTPIFHHEFLLTDIKDHLKKIELEKENIISFILFFAMLFFFAMMIYPLIK